MKNPSSEGSGDAEFQLIIDTGKRQGHEYPAVGFVMIQTVIKANRR